LVKPPRVLNVLSVGETGRSGGLRPPKSFAVARGILDDHRT
jgi:hypothetical protein